MVPYIDTEIVEDTVSEIWKPIPTGVWNN